MIIYPHTCNVRATFLVGEYSISWSIVDKKWP